jgi:hypothetical protein
LTVPFSTIEDESTLEGPPVETVGGVVVVNVWSAPSVVPPGLTATSRKW